MKRLFLFLYLIVGCTSIPKLEHSSLNPNGKKLLLGEIRSKSIRTNPYLNMIFKDRFKFHLIQKGFLVKEISEFFQESKDTKLSYNLEQYPSYFWNSAMEGIWNPTKDWEFSYKEVHSQFDFDVYVKGNLYGFKKDLIESPEDQIDLSLSLEYLDKDGNPIGNMIYSKDQKGGKEIAKLEELAKQAAEHLYKRFFP